MSSDPTCVAAIFIAAKHPHHAKLPKAAEILARYIHQKHIDHVFETRIGF
jgi:hypothetical protein